MIAVPTEDSRGSDRGREEFPQAVEAIGEDPARFLDRDLFGHGVGRLTDRDEPDFEQGDQRVVRDEKVSEPGEMIRDRIQGIDRLSVAAS